MNNLKTVKLFLCGALLFSMSTSRCEWKVFKAVQTHLAAQWKCYVTSIASVVTTTAGIKLFSKSSTKLDKSLKIKFCGYKNPTDDDINADVDKEFNDCIRAGKNIAEKAKVEFEKIIDKKNNDNKSEKKEINEFKKILQKKVLTAKEADDAKAFLKDNCPGKITELQKLIENKKQLWKVNKKYKKTEETPSAGDNK
ncbi:hypothetical protein KAH94_03425 [bacterium]|nr:hypothetical protein [bacterium]